MKYIKKVLNNACPVCGKDLTETICNSEATNDKGKQLFRIIDHYCSHCGYHSESDFCQGRAIKSEVVIKKEKRNENTK